jgi:type IV secretion system protein VirB11
MMGPLQQFFDDPAVFEVRINKFGEVVTDTVAGRIYHAVNEVDYDYVESLTDHLLHNNELGKQPVNNVILPDGSRGVICLPPAVVPGTTLCAFRKHLPVTKTLQQLLLEGRFKNWKHRTAADLIRLDPVEEELLRLLKADDVVGFLSLAVRCKRNIVVAGSTGSGKTTLTRTLLDEVPEDERVLLMEDVHEITGTKQREIGYMLYGAQEGRLSPQECLKTAMRLSPDRIFLTELRDDAAWDYLASANTGHPGGIFSTHSDDAASTPARIATLVKASEVGRLLDYDVIMKTINTTLDVVIYMKNREITEIMYDPLAKKQAMYAA